MEFAVLFLIGYLIAQAGKDNEQAAPPRPQEPRHHRHELGQHPGIITWHTHVYDGSRMHWHPTSTSTEPMFYSDEVPNPLNDPPIVIDGKEE